MITMIVHIGPDEDDEYDDGVNRCFDYTLEEDSSDSEDEDSAEISDLWNVVRAYKTTVSSSYIHTYLKASNHSLETAFTLSCRIWYWRMMSWRCLLKPMLCPRKKRYGLLARHKHSLLDIHEVYT